MNRHLAHVLNIDGRKYPMAVAEISDDRRSCKVMPYSGEIHSTRFHNGEIEIVKDPEGQYVVREAKCRTESREQNE